MSDERHTRIEVKDGIAEITLSRTKDSPPLDPLG